MLFCTPFAGHTQNWEFGVLAGGSYYYGDVNNEISIAQVRGSVGGFIRYHINERWVLRGNLMHARIVGIDSLSKSSTYQNDRNLNFFSDIWEGSLQVEYNLLDDRTRGRRIKNPFIPYIFGGIGAFHFTPQTNYLGNTYNLADLRTSGISYSQVAICVPIGIGIRYYITPRWQLGAEFGIRFTSTSNLDDIRGSSLYPDPAMLPSDVSRLVYDRNNPNRPADEIWYGRPGKERGKIDINDIYYIFGVTLSYKVSLLGGGGFSGKSVRCPRFF